MTTTTEAIAGNVTLIAIQRLLSVVMGLLVVPLALSLLYWNYATVNKMQVQAAEFEARVKALEQASSEERRQIAESRVRRDEQYVKVVEKIAALDERVRGLSDNVGRFLLIIEKRTELIPDKPRP